MDALAFAESKKALEIQPVYVLAGEERFLKLQALARIQQDVLSGADDDFARSAYSGDAIDLATVRDELSTLPFLSPRRLVVVQDADGFISKYRDGLEDYFDRPSRTGVLVLDVKSWKSNTRLAKKLPEAGLITCGVPEKNAGPWVRGWLTKRVTAQYGKKLEPAAGDLLLELVGHELGVLDQELAKLATFVGDEPVITKQAVDQLVGHSREENVWHIMDALAQGDKGKALTLVHYLIDHGQDPIGLLGALGWQLRRLAQVARMRQQGVPLQAAAQRAGLFRADQAEQILRRLGPRALLIFDWLVEADLRMKSSGDLPSRTLLERLIVRVAG